MTDPHGPDDGPPDVGSVGEEAAKLFGALSGWAREAGGAPVDEDLPVDPERQAPQAAGWGESLSGLADHAAATFAEINAHVATGSAACTYCPLCRTVHVVRQTSPEVKAHLAGAASSFLQAMVGLLATVPPPDAVRKPAAGVERIDLDDTDDTHDTDDEPTGTADPTHDPGAPARHEHDEDTPT